MWYITQFYAYCNRINLTGEIFDLVTGTVEILTGLVFPLLQDLASSVLNTGWTNIEANLGD